LAFRWLKEKGSFGTLNEKTKIFIAFYPGGDDENYSEDEEVKF